MTIIFPKNSLNETKFHSQFESYQRKIAEIVPESGKAYYFYNDYTIFYQNAKDESQEKSFRQGMANASLEKIEELKKVSLAVTKLIEESRVLSESQKSSAELLNSSHYNFMVQNETNTGEEIIGIFLGYYDSIEADEKDIKRLIEELS